MGEMENIVEFYYEKMKVTTNAGLDLAHFFKDVTGLDAGRSEIMMINRLIKLFGRFTVYFAILELSKFDKLEGNLYPLLFTVCRSRFERSHGDSSINAYVSLDKELNIIAKEIEKVKKTKIKIPSSEGLE